MHMEGTQIPALNVRCMEELESQLFDLLESWKFFSVDPWGLNEY